ncbi:MAG: TetR/AcrR family transcriptional regulator [Anaerolineae bacterium]|jgi:AcrR family transcriptional regulator
MTTHGPSKADHHAQARRREILESAAALFAEQGYQCTSVKEIADRAGIAPGTIYLYFDCKGDLLVGLMVRLAELETLGEEVRQALQGDARDFLTTMFRDRMVSAVENEETLRAVMPQMLVQPALRVQFRRQFVAPIIDIMEQYVTTQIEQDEIQAVNVPLTVRAVQSMFIGLLLLRILGDEELRAGWDEMPEVVTTLLFEGLNPSVDGSGPDVAEA